MLRRALQGEEVTSQEVVFRAPDQEHRHTLRLEVQVQVQRSPHAGQGGAREYRRPDLPAMW